MSPGRQSIRGRWACLAACMNCPCRGIRHARTALLTVMLAVCAGMTLIAEEPADGRLVRCIFEQEITGFGPLPPARYGDAQFVITGVSGGGSGRPVVFSSGDPSVARIDGTIVTIVGAGSTIITANQSGYGDYGAANPVSQPLIVAKAALSVVAMDSTRAFGASNPAFAGSLTGVVAEDGISATYASSAGPFTPAGTYGPGSPQAIRPTLIDPKGRLAHYSVTSAFGTLTIRPLAQTIVGLPGTVSLVYGAPSYSMTGVFGGGSGNPLVFSCDNPAVALIEGRTVTITGSGTAAITVTQAGDSAFAPADAAVQILSVERAPLVVTAPNASRPYGASNPVFAGTVIGVVGTDGIFAVFTTTANETTPIGTYGPDSTSAIVPSINDPAKRLSHYSVTTVNGTLTVTPAASAVPPATLLPATSGGAGAGGGSGCGAGGGMGAIIAALLVAMRGRRPNTRRRVPD